MSAQPQHPDEVQNRRIEASEADTAFSAALDEARKQQVDPTEFLTEEFLDTVTDSDLERAGLEDGHERKHNVEQKLGAHLSKQIALGNITRDQYEKERLLDNARRHLVQMTYRRQGGTGSECTGETRKRYTGGEGAEKPLLTDDLDDQLDSGFEVKDSLRSNSVGGRLIAKLMEAQVVTRSEGFKRESPDGASGYLDKLTGGLLG